MIPETIDYKAAIKDALQQNEEFLDVVLEQAEAHIEKMAGKAMVIKCSGSVLFQPQARQNFIKDIVCLKQVGIKPIVVHGGGEQINQKLDELNIESEFYDGLRVTTPEIMEAVKEVLLDISNNLCSDISNQAVGINAIVQSNAIKAKPMNEDLGLVGEVVEIDESLLQSALDDENILIIPCIGFDIQDNQALNINADTAASKIAVALKAERLHLLSNVDGIYADFDSDKSKIESVVTAKQAKQMIKSGAINGGMIPKVKACLGAFEGGITASHILNGTKPNNLILELLTDEGIGTMLISEE